MEYQRRKRRESNLFFKGTVMWMVLLLIGLFACGCVGGKNKADEQEMPVANVKPLPSNEAPKEIEVKQQDSDTRMVDYDVSSVGRSDPFMPSDELQAFADARNSAIAEANEKNAEIARLKGLKLKTIREADDISPYSFNLPVPPTSLSSTESYAAKITRTKVVGIMYNKNNPSAILNVDDKDYLVRPGDKIIGQEYKVVQINPNWITVSLGSNVYSASIGELFEKDELDKSKNDLYNLKNRFGGRKS